MFPQEPRDLHPEPAIYDNHTIETPEQLRLDFPVAGIGSRFLAIAIDSLIQVAAALVVILTFSILSATGVLSRPGLSPLWLLALSSVFFFLLFFGYYAFFEIIWNGQTPGKRSIGIRVIADSGRPLTAAESIGRNLFRIVDQLPGFYGVGITVALLNRRNKRLGDLVAGSVVIRESSLDVIRPVWQTASAPGERILGAKSLSDEEMQLIDAFLNRRGELAPDVRSRMAAQILTQLKPALAFLEDRGASNESILEALARESRSTNGG
jgi:uncharacterized RDD family membrane protein YckC